MIDINFRYLAGSLLIASLFGCGSASENAQSNQSATNSSAIATGELDTSLPNAALLERMRAQTGLTKDFAVAQFVAHFGQLDNAQQYKYDNSMGIFATHALEELMLFKDELEPALLAEIYQRILPTVGTTSSTIEDINKLSSSHQLRHGHEDYLETLATIISDMENLIGRTLVNDVELIRINRYADIYDDGTSGPIMFALSASTRNDLLDSGQVKLGDYDLKSADNCWIGINDGVDSQAFDSRAENEIQMILAHEVMHCFQFELGASHAPSWVKEGLATWAGEAYAGATIFNEAHWQGYEQSPYHLFKTSNPYSAVGFYSHVSNALSDGLWSSMPTLMESSSRKSTDNLVLASELMGEDAYNTWPSKDINRIDWGEDWRIIGIGGRIPQRPALPLVEQSVSAEFGELKSLYINTDRTFNQPMILSVSSEGAGFMHWENGGNTMAFGDTQHFCVKGDCVCQDSEFPNGFTAIEDANELGNLVIAMTGQLDKSDSKLRYDFNEVVALCPQVPEPTPEPQTDSNNNPELPQPTGPQPEPVPGPGPVATPEPDDNNTIADACLIGDWYLDNAYTAQQFWGSSQGMILGDMRVDLRADGSGTNTIDLHFIPPAEDDFEIDFRFTGNTTFTWQASNTKDGNFISGTQLSENIQTQVNANGVELPLNGAQPPVDQRQFTFGGSDGKSAYVCTSTSLLITEVEGDAYSARYVR